MTELWIALAAGALAALAFWLWHGARLRRIGRERLLDDVVKLEKSGEHFTELAPSLRVRTWIPWTVAIVVLIATGFILRWAPVYSIASAVILGVITHLVQSYWHQKNEEKLETQLANSIDIMVASLSAGAGVMESLDGATREAGQPLKHELQELLGRIRYGEDPQRVFEDFAVRIPLDVYRLFSFTMAVHGEVGGSLAPTLSTVGKSIRDRIEIGRRVRASSTQAQASVIGIVAVTYFLALLMWRTNPRNFEAFLKNPLGQNFVAAAMVLQAIGLLWIRKLAQMRF